MQLSSRVLSLLLPGLVANKCFRNIVTKSPLMYKPSAFSASFKVISQDNAFSTFESNPPTTSHWIKVTLGD